MAPRDLGGHGAVGWGGGSWGFWGLVVLQGSHGPLGVPEVFEGI